MAGMVSLRETSRPTSEGLLSVVDGSSGELLSRGVSAVRDQRPRLVVGGKVYGAVPGFHEFHGTGVGGTMTHDGDPRRF